MSRIALIVLMMITWVSCVPPKEKAPRDILIDLSDPSIQNIYNLIDRRQVDSIVHLLQADDVTERYVAALGAASMKDIRLVKPLLTLLNQDPSTEIREIAAYALGQQGEQSALGQMVTAFGSQDTLVYNTPLRAKLLEAIGKIADDQTLEQLSTVSTYQATDDQLLLGQARGVYRAARRNVYSPSSTALMVDRVTDEAIPAATRLVAAQYLARHRELVLDSTQQNQLLATLAKEENVNVEMALASTLTKTGDSEVLAVLLAALQASDTDARVKSNILRGLGNFSYPEYQQVVKAMLDHKNPHLFELAASLLAQQMPRQEAREMIAKAQEETDPLRKPQILGIALHNLPVSYANSRNIINLQLTEGIKSTNQAIVKAQYLKALAKDPLNAETIVNYGLASSDDFVRTTAINSIPTLLTNMRTTAIYPGPRGMAAFRLSIAEALMDVLRTGDSGSIAAISSIAKREDLALQSVDGFADAIKAGMATLTLPKDLEAMQEATSALSYLEDTTYTFDRSTQYHPIDWSILEGLSDSARAYIITTKGKIELELYPKMAPGSVANFVKLTNDNYYDSKTIHRVVPNFVVQGGCPRGDGYGSLDYTIRTEVGPLYYDEGGYVGMASAGRDTEGTQWFITHSPTPHLDGNYTIFGKVISGMDVVHSIEVGDRIQDVRILRY